MDVDNPVAKFEKVYVIHTSESLHKFVAWEQSDEWLKTAGLCQSDLVHHVVEMTEDLDRRLDEMIAGVANAISSHSSKECYFDLTGGITMSRVALAILAFLLGASNVYTLEVDFGGQRERYTWKLAELRQAGVPVAYRRISGLERFDMFGMANLTTVDRVTSRLDELRSSLDRSMPQRGTEIEHLISLLGLAEKFRIEQMKRAMVGSLDEHEERAATRSLLFHAMAAAEALLDLVLDDVGQMTLGHKLQKLRRIAEANSAHPIDSQTLRNLSELLRHLRNRAAHWSQPVPDHESLILQGDLGLQLAKSFIWLITMSLESFLDEKGEVIQIQNCDDSALDGESWFVGIDGDATGGYIADSMRDSDDCVDEIRVLSQRIATAIQSIERKVVGKFGKKSVLFATGDNVLFCGKVSPEFVRDLLQGYRQATGLTASAGIGRTPRQASIALSLAKAEGGGAVKIVSLAGNVASQHSDR